MKRFKCVHCRMSFWVVPNGRRPRAERSRCPDCLLAFTHGHNEAVGPIITSVTPDEAARVDTLFEIHAA